jgi:hypothetical protein
VSTLLECLRLHQPLPVAKQDMATPHPAANHLDAAELSLRCVRRAYADDNLPQARAFVRSAIEDLQSALERMA